MKPYVWKLPSFKNTRSEHTMIYSKWYGLLCIGGNKGNSSVTNEIMQLSMNNLDDIEVRNKWEWKQIATMEKKLKHVSCCMINDRTLFICNGMKSTTADSKFVNIYDFEIKEWISLKQSKYARSQSGIYFDKLNKKIYNIGGNTSGFSINKSEYYDLTKNEWYRLPNTSMKHGYHPLVWLHPNNKNILIITSYIENCMESYDLRMSQQQQIQIESQEMDLNAFKIEWSCQACTFINTPSALKCAICNTPNPTQPISMYGNRRNNNINYDYGWRTMYGLPQQYPMYNQSLQDVFKTKFAQYGLSKCNERILRFNDDYF